VPGNPELLRSLFEVVRAAARDDVWSRGVQLARRGKVLAAGRQDEEIAMRVSGGAGSGKLVHLNPLALVWECECPSTDEVCDHAAAAVIALQMDPAVAEPTVAPPVVRARVGYRFEADGRGLVLRRVLVRGNELTPLRVSIPVLAKRSDEEAVDVQPLDVRVETLLGGTREVTLNQGLMGKLFKLLADCEYVWLGTRRVSVDASPLLPVVTLEDRGDGFVLSLRRDLAVTQTFANGAALCGEVLRAVGEAQLTQRERDELRQERYFGPADVYKLVSEVLPAFAGRVPVDVRSERLPRTVTAEPYLVVTTQRRGDRLEIRPEIVYGDPPVGRVRGGELLPVGDRIPRRNLAGEERLRVQLRRELGLELDGERTFATEGAIALNRRLQEFGGEIIGDDHEAFFLAPPLTPELELEPGVFGLRWRKGPKGPEVEVDNARMLAAWREGGTLAALPGGGFTALPVGWLTRHGALVADLLAAREASGALPACALPDLARLCSALGVPPPAAFEKLRALVDGFAGLPAATLPDDLRAELREYQLAGVAWLDFLRDADLGALLADDMGLGKTLQALCALRGPALVVCPTSVLHGWEEQIQRFRPGLRCARYHGAGRRLDPDVDVTLTTYGLLRADADALAAVRWQTVVLDEAQAIKNPTSQVARAAYRLQAQFRVALTGTPIENRLEELWSQYRFLNPSLLGDQASFQERYARPIADGTPGVAARLRERIRPFLLRRLKSEVARELPPRTEDVLHCELSESERAVYDAVRAATRDDVVARLRSGGNVLEALEALLRLRQAACHAALVPGQKADTSAKLEVLLEVLTEIAAEGHRALVFSQWTSLLDLVEPHLNDAKLAFERLDGSTTDRGGVVERFQAEDGPPVLLISLRAGGTGLNLTRADHVFLLDPWWNPAVEDQAADRAHRIGQERPVFIHRLVALDTVEERILALQQHKRALAQAALGGADAATSLTREDLLALLD